MDLLGQVLNLDQRTDRPPGLFTEYGEREREREREREKESGRGTDREREGERKRERGADRQKDLGFSKYDVDVRGRAFEHVWSADDKQDAFGLPDGDPGHTVNWLQTQLGHGLTTRQRRSTETVRVLVSSA